MALLPHDLALGALLLERLDPVRSLHALPPDAAVAAAGTVLVGLHVPAPVGLKTTGEVGARWQAVLPVRWKAAEQRIAHRLDARVLEQVVESCADLALPTGEAMLVHGDFHDANVLARTGATGWAPIDPKPLAGDGAFDLVPLLRNSWPAPSGNRFHLDVELGDLTAVAATYLRAGAQRPVLAGALEDAAAEERYRQALGVPLHVVRLMVDPPVVHQRLRRRHEDDHATLSWHLHRSGQLHDVLTRAEVDDTTLGVTGLTRAQIAQALIDAAGWDADVEAQ